MSLFSLSKQDVKIAYHERVAGRVLSFPDVGLTRASILYKLRSEQRVSGVYDRACVKQATVFSVSTFVFGHESKRKGNGEKT